jgi:hypothetical protein
MVKNSYKCFRQKGSSRIWIDTESPRTETRRNTKERRNEKKDNVDVTIWSGLTEEDSGNKVMPINLVLG